MRFATCRPGADRRSPVRSLARGCRAVGTGLAFVVFAGGALVLVGAVLPALRLTCRSRVARERRTQYLIHLAFRAFVRFITALGLVRISLAGGPRLCGQPPALVIANHPTLIDVVCLIAAMPQADCIVKPRVWRNRFFGALVAGAGYVPNSEGPEVIETCAARLRAGRWVLLFPEGTRSPVGRLGPFHRGAAHIALRAPCDILPVVITCQPPLLVKSRPWYRVPERRPRLSLTVGERLGPGPYLDDEHVGRAARAWTDELRALYAARLESVSA